MRRDAKAACCPAPTSPTFSTSYLAFELRTIGVIALGTSGAFLDVSCVDYANDHLQTPPSGCTRDLECESMKVMRGDLPMLDEEAQAPVFELRGFACVDDQETGGGERSPLSPPWRWARVWGWLSNRSSPSALQVTGGTVCHGRPRFL
jgi:hypothetical protein